MGQHSVQEALGAMEGIYPSAWGKKKKKQNNGSKEIGPPANGKSAVRQVQAPDKDLKPGI